MGTACMASLAYIFLWRFERDLPDGYHLKLIFLIFLVLTNAEEELDKFVAHANAVHLIIKFTCNQSRDAVEFLDTKVRIAHQTSELYTSLYTKHTDTRDLLHFTSAHFLNTKWGGPYGQLLRIKWICTRDFDFTVESRVLFTLNVVTQKISCRNTYKASRFQQDDLLDIKIKVKPETQVFVITFNLANHNIMGIIKKYWPIQLILHTSRGLRGSFYKEPMCAFRRKKMQATD